MTADGSLVALDYVRILSALLERKRYKYVQPRVLREGAGWRVVSPNCSRNIDPAGGEIDIAWLAPATEGAWQLYARDHARGTWLLKADGLTLAAALARLCKDPMGEFWR